jgi:hypothetical protein
LGYSVAVPSTKLIIFALLPWVVLAVLMVWERRTRRDRNEQWRKAWEALGAQHGLTLQVAPDGTPELHGTDGAVAWVLRVLGTDFGGEAMVGFEVQALTAVGDGRLFAWSPGMRPSGLPELAQRLTTEDGEFDGVFEVWADTAGLVRRLGPPARRALLSLGQTALVLEGSRARLSLGVDPLGVDDHALSSGREALKALAAEG